MRLSLLLFLFCGLAAAQNADPGRATFEARCARCHGADGGGGEMGPAIESRLASIGDPQLAELIRKGRPTRGMPATAVAETAMVPLTRFLRSIQQRAESKPVVRRSVSLASGAALEGVVLNEGFDDLQLRSGDGRVHLLRKSGERYREAAPGTNWPGYNGDPRGNRFTTIDQITPANVSKMGPKWVFPLPGTGNLQVTPSVVGGIMYIAGPSECYAIDAGSGREIWHYRSRAKEAGGTNRGVATAGDRVFLVAERNHLIALNRFTGEKIWDTQTSDPKQGYFSTSAPLAVGDLVISGVGGGEHGARGFLAAYDQATGKEAWKFWTVPKPGEPAADSWQGKGIDHPGAPTWFTGTYDPESGVLYWPTGNPAAEYYGDDRLGDNLYSDCILALDVKTGKLKWYYQFTPHDLWDWDATETPMLIDADWQGAPRKLLIHGNRNGFFYVFDRTNGKLLLAKPFVKKLTWASSIDGDGRPVKKPGQEPSAEGTRVCPSQDGATNWFSPSYNPATGLYYMQTFEKCSVYTKRSPGVWQGGKEYLGGVQKVLTDDNPQRILRALNIGTGEVVWELPQPGPANSWGGTIATSTGLVFVAEESGSFMAVDAKSGKPLWSFPTNHSWHASPMTYTFDGKQYFAIAAGSSVIAFGLAE